MNATTLSMLEAALAYARRGFRVMPLHPMVNGQCSCIKKCSSPGKHPQIADWGCKASKDETVIRQWWSTAAAGIGICTGEGSGIFVLDIDGALGEDSFRILQAQHNWTPSTLTAKTGKGRHLYFSHPGFKVKNSVGTKFGVGIDVRGDGGYVVAPPSAHHSGSHYQWEDESLSIAHAPAWLLSKVGVTDCPSDNQQEEHYGIPVGHRNNELTRLAGCMRAEGKDAAQIEQELLVINNENCDEPLSASEVRSISVSIAKYEAAPGRSLSLKERRENNPLYWFPLNVNDWCSNPEIVLMNERQVAWLIWLRVECWKNCGSLPNDSQKLWKLARASSKAAFEKEKALVLNEYDEETGSDGEPILVNRQLKKLWLKQCASYQQKLRASASSARVRKERKENEKHAA